jgi:hypothetical protein
VLESIITVRGCWMEAVWNEIGPYRGVLAGGKNPTIYLFNKPCIPHDDDIHSEISMWIKPDVFSPTFVNINNNNWRIWLVKQTSHDHSENLEKDHFDISVFQLNSFVYLANCVLVNFVIPVWKNYFFLPTLLRWSGVRVVWLCQSPGNQTQPRDTL